MIPDDDFIQSDQVPGPSKEEIRCLVMCKAMITSDDVVVDVGCGSGGFTVESAQLAKKVIALDKNPEAIKITSKNIKKYDLEEKVQLIKGDALKVIEKLDFIDVFLVGGSSGDLSQIISKGIEKLTPNGRIVITSILLETRVEAVQTLKNMGLSPEVVEVTIAKGKIIQRGTMMMGRNPITIIYSVKK
ncbi:MAG: precorrin-6Y C5,15-methyltransferase (decarboxylating) subunit CbiT [Euryarchaeota archaeon]|uniref:precorrin-6Y C5,15-methyltransferase (decarboxylating) subunit CbiT n=1 Tax=Methanobacterium sp. MZD130B TaxID=3394378 RepID=UPI00176077A1|nr:precorrin-6Y C5,15-methyltransferase (decarboxylating) subunit CbiT [Euryarchaeota archaeon]HHT18729.1 precorrin-6Y C5,15-methyltransferase (decarboxylating) subunit CbiT [Methanobacterium sp.]